MPIEYIKSLNNVLFKPLTMRQLPIHIQLEPTTYCNLNCAACLRAKYLHSSRHLSLGEFKMMISQIHPSKISLSGAGEPLMNPDFFEMVALAKAQGCSINTTSNATLFTPDVCARMVKSGLGLIKISIDGATRTTYQKSRGEDRFEQVLQGIQTLATVKKQLNSMTPYIRLNYVIFQGNYQEMAETVRLAASLEVDAIYFQPLELIGIEERQQDLVGDMTYEALVCEIRRALQINREYPMKTNLRALVNNLPLYWKKYLLETHRQDPRICLLPWFSTYITLEGAVHPCCSCSQPETVMGNIFETPMETIWNGTQYQAFRKAIRKGVRPFSICANCVPRTLSDTINYSRILPGFFSA